MMPVHSLAGGVMKDGLFDALRAFNGLPGIP